MHRTARIQSPNHHLLNHSIGVSAVKFLLARILLVSMTMLALAPFAAAQSKKPLPEKPLDLNAATLEELQTLPTVGPATAKAIVRFREKSGPFRKAEELLAIPGFTKKRLAKIRPYITVTLPAPSS